MDTSLHTATHDLLEDPLTSLQLRNLILQLFPLATSSEGLRSNGFDILIGHGVDDDGGKDCLESFEDVAFDDLGGDVGYEDFQDDLRANVLIGERGGETSHWWKGTYFVDCEQAVEDLAAAKVFHVDFMLVGEQLEGRLGIELWDRMIRILRAVCTWHIFGGHCALNASRNLSLCSF